MLRRVCWVLGLACSTLACGSDPDHPARCEDCTLSSGGTISGAGGAGGTGGTGAGGTGGACEQHLENGSLLRAEMGTVPTVDIFGEVADFSPFSGKAEVEVFAEPCGTFIVHLDTAVDPVVNAKGLRRVQNCWIGLRVTESAAPTYPGIIVVHAGEDKFIPPEAETGGHAPYDSPFTLHVVEKAAIDDAYASTGRVWQPGTGTIVLWLASGVTVNLGGAQTGWWDGSNWSTERQPGSIGVVVVMNVAAEEFPGTAVQFEQVFSGQIIDHPYLQVAAGYVTLGFISQTPF